MTLELIIGLLIIIVLYLFLKKIDSAGEMSGANRDAQTESSTESEEETMEGDPIYIDIGDKSFVTTHQIKTYLFMGTDNSGNEDAKGEEYKGSMADFLLLLVVDKTNETYGMLQLNRDTMTEITLLQKNGKGYASADMQLCTAHWYGGDKESSCDNTVEAVSNLLGGVPIDGYYALPMEELQQLNAAVGGVTITMEDDLTAIDPAMTKGATLKLTDEQAYKFVRARMEVGDGSNTSRMKRQKQFLDSFMDIAKTKNGEDQKFIIKLYEELKPYSTADIKMKQISKLAVDINGYASQGVLTIDGEVKIGKALDDGLEHTEFYLNEQSMEDTMTTLYSLEEDMEEESEDTEE